MRRVSLDLSQRSLARQLGVTSQQIQKYERGKNRVSASRLFELSSKLNVSVSYFFPQEDAKEDTLREDITFQSVVNMRDAHELLSAFSKVEDCAMRASIIELAQSIAKFKK
ncbi:MAG: helix-turn-helix domain-containing protein [Hyphomicrobiales bacterium]